VFPDACAQHEPAAQRIVDAYLAGVNLHQTRVECQPVISSDGWAASILGGEVTSGFRTGGRPDHGGVDIGAPHGTPVFVAAGGRLDTDLGRPQPDALCEHRGRLMFWPALFRVRLRS
jgi:murein DD-endopeptidase MepM/ murein hydrolase activator NlpD